VTSDPAATSSVAQPESIVRAALFWQPARATADKDDAVACFVRQNLAIDTTIEFSAAGSAYKGFNNLNR
jgi:hypothetical protein